MLYCDASTVFTLGRQAWRYACHHRPKGRHQRATVRHTGPPAVRGLFRPVWTSLTVLAVEDLRHPTPLQLAPPVRDSETHLGRRSAHRMANLRQSAVLLQEERLRRE